MSLKIYSYQHTLQVNVTALHSFALAPRAQYGVTALGKENDHCRRAAPCLAPSYPINLKMRVVRAIAALSMQGWGAGNGYSLVKRHNAAVEALRGSRRAGLKALHAALDVLDWGVAQPANIQHHLNRFYLPLTACILRLIGYSSQRKFCVQLRFPG